MRLLKFLSVLLIITTAYSCSKLDLVEVFLDTISTKEDRLLTEAKNAFNGEYTDIKKSRSTINKSASNSKNKRIDIQQKLFPIWEFRKNISNRSNQALELPLIKSQKKIRIYNLEESSITKEQEHTIFKNSLTRLLTIKRNGTFHNVIVTYIPSSDYNKSLNRIGINQLGDFSGYIEYQNLQEEVLFIAKFKDGKFIKKYYLGNVKNEKNNIAELNKNKAIQSNQQMRNSSSDCGWVTVDVPMYGSVCITAGDPPIEYCGDHVISYEQHSVYIPCEPESENPEFCDLPENYYICLGGDGGTTPGTPTTTDSIKLQVNNNNLREKIREKLEEIKELETYCLYNELLKQVEKLDISFSDNVSELSTPINMPVYNSANSKVYIDRNHETFLSPPLIIHELFHAYQHKAAYKTSMGSYRNGQPGYANIEFERAIFEDIHRATSGDIGLIGSGHFPPQTTTLGKRDLDWYIQWILDITEDGTVYPRIDNSNSQSFENSFFEHLQTFDKYGHPGYTKGGRDTGSGPKALKEFFKHYMSKCN